MNNNKENKEILKEENKTKNKKNNYKKILGSVLLIFSIFLLFLEIIVFLATFFNPLIFSEIFYQITKIQIFDYLNIYQFYALFTAGFLLDLSFIILLLIISFYLIDKKKSKKENQNLKKNLKITFFAGLLLSFFAILFSYSSLYKMFKNNCSYKNHRVEKKQKYKKDNFDFKAKINYYENINGTKKSIKKEFNNLKELDDYFQKINTEIY